MESFRRPDHPSSDAPAQLGREGQLKPALSQADPVDHVAHQQFYNESLQTSQAVPRRDLFTKSFLWVRADTYNW